MYTSERREEISLSTERACVESRSKAGSPEEKKNKKEKERKIRVRVIQKSQHGGSAVRKKNEEEKNTRAENKKRERAAGVTEEPASKE
jgi:hypothetical protein